MNAAYEAPHLWNPDPGTRTEQQADDDALAGYTTAGWYFVSPDESRVIGPFCNMFQALVHQNAWEP